MFFIVNSARKAATVATCFGPYASQDEAIFAARRFLVPGDYVIHGPASAVHKVSIAAPEVSSEPVWEAI